MAKAIFFSLPLHGHTNPSLPLVEELVRRGEEVIYYSNEAFAEKVRQTGARYQPYSNAFFADLNSVFQRLEAIPFLFMRATREVIRDELERVRKERPDYILHDAAAAWGKCLAEITRVPAVASTSTFAVNRRVLAFGWQRGVRPKRWSAMFSKLRYVAKALQTRRGIRREQGIRGPGILDLFYGHSGLNIVYTSRFFQPCGATFDDSFQFVGPSIAPRRELVPFVWDRLRHPIVLYVSLGTVFNEAGEFYRTCFDAFARADCQVVLSAGRNVRTEELAGAPANFIVERYVPQLEVLERAAAFVTHGGMNSVSESLYHGVPVVVIPQMGEQAIVGRRVEQLGAGLFLPKEHVTAEQLRTAVRRLREDDSFRRECRRIGESFRSAGGVRRAADAILDYTRGTQCGRSFGVANALDR